MKMPGVIILLMFLGAAPALLWAQGTETFTFTGDRPVPDGRATGLVDVRSVNSAIRSITAVKVRLKVTGEFNGDLYGYVHHASGFTVLLNRPGKTEANPYGYDDSGLDVTFQTGAANGDVHLYQSVMLPDQGSPLTGVWQPDGRAVDPAIVTDASPRSTSLANFNGLDAAGSWTLFLADLESGGTNMLTEWALEITGVASPTLAWANPADITYGTALGASQLNATATYNATNVPGTFAYTPDSDTVLNAGSGQTLSVTFTPSDSTSFQPVSTNVTINVLPASLTITAVDNSKVYGAALPELKADYNGFVNGDTAASLGTPVTLVTEATTASPVGVYPITASGAQADNYTIAYVHGTLSIYKAMTALSLDASPNPSEFGQPVLFAATITADSVSVIGTVAFSKEITLLSASSLSGGQATFTTAALTAGEHIITARYSGDANFHGSTNTILQRVNPSPVLEPIPDQRAYVLVPLVLTNRPINPGLLSPPLTFGLVTKAPAGARLHTNGVLCWRPTRAQARSTNDITVWMTDSGGVRATNTFRIIVDDYLELSLGQSVLRAGQTSSVPVALVTTTGLTNLQVLLQAPEERLIPLDLIGWAPEVGSAKLQQLAANTWQMDFTAAPGQELQTTQELAHLSILTVPNRSAFVVLVVSDRVTNFKADGSSIWRTLSSNGRAVVIDQEPLVEMLAPVNGFSNLMLYGIAGVSYNILQAPVLPTTEWQPVWLGTMPANLSMHVSGLPNTGPMMFFRAQEQ